MMEKNKKTGDNGESVIKFHSDFQRPVLRAYKTATTRTKKYEDIKVGTVIRLHFIHDDKTINDKHRAEITSVIEKKFKDLNKSDAAVEGYAHEDLLKHELKNIYPDIREDSIVYIYRFNLQIGG